MKTLRYILGTFAAIYTVFMLLICFMWMILEGFTEELILIIPMFFLGSWLTIKLWPTVNSWRELWQNYKQHVRSYYQRINQPLPRILQPVFKEKTNAENIKTQRATDTSQTIADSGADIYHFVELCEIAIADNKITTEEALLLQSWLDKHTSIRDRALVFPIYKTLKHTLHDGVIDSIESNELMVQLSEFCDDTRPAPSEQAVRAEARNKKHKEQIKQQNHKQKKAKAAKKQKNRIQSAQPIAIADFDGLHDGAHLQMRYKDSQGNMSERHIIFREYSINDSGREYIKAVCTKRKALRTFRSDRIESLFNLDTGEVIV